MYILKLVAVLSAIALSVNGLAPQRQVLVTYPQGAPESDVNEYKTAITDAGGRILHEFSLFKYVSLPLRKVSILTHFCRGFIVKASTQAIDTIHTLSQEYKPTIENDSTVSIQGD